MLSEDVNYISFRFKFDLLLKSKDLFSETIGIEIKPENKNTDLVVKS